MTAGDSGFAAHNQGDDDFETADSESTSASISGLRPAHMYHFRVQAANKEGRSAYSSVGGFASWHATAAGSAESKRLPFIHEAVCGKEMTSVLSLRQLQAPAKQSPLLRTGRQFPASQPSRRPPVSVSAGMRRPTTALR